MDSLKSFRDKTDITTVVIAYILMLIGVMLVYSATIHEESVRMQNMYRTQFVWILLGSAAFYAVTRIPGKIIYGWSYLFYAIILVMLVMVLIHGRSTLGAVRWFAVGPFKVQPSEFAKIGTMLALARILAQYPVSLMRPLSLVRPILLTIVPMALILKQPDLGTSMVFSAMLFAMLYFGGLTLWEALFLASPVLSLVLAFNSLLWALFFIGITYLVIKHSRHMFVTVSVIAVNFMTGILLPLFWGRLHDYQKQRILTFVDPSLDPAGAGYQVIQSTTSIGSGRMFGKGFLQGSQTKLSFLPEQHTDFIFAVLGEQFGFVGCTVVIILFGIFVYRIMKLAYDYENKFLSLVAVGIGAQFAFHIVINIAMTIGLMPVTGIPLPFLSYGGSFLLTCMILLGLAASIPKKYGEY
ncbi:MAG: rod shape-determining protein RodA [Fibrobacteres bacterium]|nr:rod shape-determining protein RodA [Fibrobacterota bacterium]